jgi:hypothetical protein
MILWSVDIATYGNKNNCETVRVLNLVTHCAYAEKCTLYLEEQFFLWYSM